VQRSGRRGIFQTGSARLPFVDSLVSSRTAGNHAASSSRRRIARTLAAVRSTGKNGFCWHVRFWLYPSSKTYWFESQRQYDSPGHCRITFFRSSRYLATLSAQLAIRWVPAAARPRFHYRASYLIGVTYTAMLPNDVRSSSGSTTLSSRTHSPAPRNATLAGVEWSLHARVLDSCLA